ncbi:MAG: hypothetical protein U9R72_09105 [Chloroflexota bacterium]|nr:hypothetical protein [Chloroflexota bacterium]
MKKLLTVAVAVVTPVVLVVVLTQSAAASAAPHAGPAEAGEMASVADTECITGTQDSGAEYLICWPEGWEVGDRELMVYAHGYMAPDRDIEIPQDQMVLNGVSITETVTDPPFRAAFATTSYSANGLAVRPAIDDLLDLVDIFHHEKGTPNHIYLVGVSEGGLITALSVEEHPMVYDGGLAMCGPYGDFQGQINHFGDFRVVFDYFFPGLMPGSAITITLDVMEAWRSGSLTETISNTVGASENMTKVTQLLTVTNVSPYAYDPPTSTKSILDVLQYNVYATEDAKEKLGGQPFDNQDREYEGSNDDVALNAGVERFTATVEALEAISDGYQTTGKLSTPLVTLHTTGDPVVPYWHATSYETKIADEGGSAFHSNHEVAGHGHCSFSPWDVLGAFFELEAMVRSHQRVFLPVIVRGY